MLLWFEISSNKKEDEPQRKKAAGQPCVTRSPEGRSGPTVASPKPNKSYPQRKLGKPPMNVTRIAMGDIWPSWASAHRIPTGLPSHAAHAGHLELEADHHGASASERWLYVAGLFGLGWGMESENQGF